MSEFTLRIKLGNEAMQSGYDIAIALQDIADDIKDFEYTKNISGTIMDLNGNSVGKWQVK